MDVGQPPVDSGHSAVILAAVFDVGIYIVQGDGVRRFAGPGEEELQIIEVMDGGGGVRVSASQSLVESSGVGHNIKASPVGRIWAKPR